MNILLEVNDSKAAFVMELLNNFSFVKAKPISPAKALLMEEIKEAVDNLKLVEKGKLKAQPLDELLNEL
jgi:hypothetical protein